MHRLFRSSLDVLLHYRWLVVFAVLVITSAMGYLATGLTKNNNQETWVPQEGRAAALYQETDQIFSSNNVLFAVLYFPDKGVFHPDSLKRIRETTELLMTVPELFQVTSLTNVPAIRTLSDGISVGSLIDEIPSDPEKLAELEHYVLSKEMYVNTLLSPDGRYGSILANIAGGFEETKVAAKVLKLLEDNLDKDTFFFGGDAALTLYVDRFMIKDMWRQIPMMAVAMVLILGFGLRRVWGVVLSLGVVGLCIVWTLGFQRIFAMPMNVMTPPLLVLLIAMGSDYAVHTVNHYMRRGEIHHTAQHVSVPIMMSALTTVAGVLTFATTRIQVLKDFGLGLSFGLATASILSITVMIVLLRIFRPKPERTREDSSLDDTDPREDHIFCRFIERLTLTVLRFRRLVLAVSVILVLVMSLGIMRITTNVDAVSFLPEKSVPSRGHRVLEEHFGGIYPVSLYFRGDMQEPSLLKLQMRLENVLRGNDKLSGFTSISGMLAEMNRLLTGVFTVPDTRAGVAGLWLLVESEPLMSKFVNEERDMALINAMVKESATDAMKQVADYINAKVPPGTDEDLVTLEPSRLSPEGRAGLLDLQIRETALQIASLEASYTHSGPVVALASVDTFIKPLHRAWDDVQELPPGESVTESIRTLLENEFSYTLSATSARKIIEALQADLAEGNGSLTLQHLLAGPIGMHPEDVTYISDQLQTQFRDACRMERVQTLREKILPLVRRGARENPNFLYRSEGVLWELLSAQPAFLWSECSGIPGIRNAVVKRVPVRIDQTGTPELFRQFDSLLGQSQLQSIAMASLAVLLIVSLTQRSFRKGIVSIIAILVPLEISVGLMGWLGIPLDFGTVLVGALIIGLGVDGCIHILYYEARTASREGPPDQILVRTFKNVGKAVLTANATTAGGFLMLMFSSSSVARNFGMVNAMAICLVTISTLTLLPALMRTASMRDPGN